MSIRIKQKNNYTFSFENEEALESYIKDLREEAADEKEKQIRKIIERDK